MDERIKELRKALKLTQKEFGDRIGIKPNTVATYEQGRNSPIDAVVGLICREFNVNEAWLRTGAGKMFAPKTTNALDALAKEHKLTPGVKVFIEKLLNLKPEYQQVFVDLSLEVAAALEKNGETLPESHEHAAGDEVQVSVEDEDGDKKVIPLSQDGDEEVYADRARQYRLSEKEPGARVSSAKESGAG